MDRYFIFLVFLVLTTSIKLTGQSVAQKANGTWIFTSEDGNLRTLDLKKKDDLEILIKYSKASKNEDNRLLSDKIALDLKETENKLQTVIIKLEKLRIQKNYLEQSLSTEKQELNEEEKISIRKELKSINDLENFLKKESRTYTDESRVLREIQIIEPEKRAEVYQHFTSERKFNLQIKEPNNSQLATEPKNLKRERNVKRKKLASDFELYDPEKDVLLNPLKIPCSIEYAGLDEFTGKNRKDHSAQNLFFHTPESLSKVFQDKEYMTCDASLSSVTGGALFLNLYFSIANRDASKLFGGFEKGTVINLKFIDGDNFAIINNRTDPGLYDPKLQSVIFRAQCNLGAGIQEKIAKKSLDKIRVTWQTGYEDYEVFDVDLLIRQYKCLL